MEHGQDYATSEIAALASKMKELQAIKDDLSGALKRTNKDLDKIRMEELPAAMEEAGVESIRLAGIGNVCTRVDVWASVNSSLKPEAWQWLRENGFEHLISETINGSTLKAWSKEQLREGTEIPEELFNITPYTYAVILK